MSIITHILLISVYLYFLIDVFNEQTRQITKKIEKSKQPTTIEPKNIVTTNPTGNWFYFIVHAHKTFVFCTFPCSQYVAQVFSVQSILGIFRTIFLYFSTFSSVFSVYYQKALHLIWRRASKKVVNLAGGLVKCFLLAM